MFKIYLRFDSNIEGIYTEHTESASDCIFAINKAIRLLIEWCNILDSSSELKISCNSQYGIYETSYDKVMILLQIIEYKISELNKNNVDSDKLRRFLFKITNVDDDIDIVHFCNSK